ncbi:MAG TPA: glycosyltransferase family 4 protein [Gemmatimonadales bacterium]
MLITLAAAVATLLLTGLARQLALAHALLDLPNERSLHAAPVPRGGGLAIVAVTLAGTAALGGAGWLPLRTTVALLGGGALVAGVGWLDDRRSLPVATRLAAHLAAALWALGWLDGLPVLAVGEGVVCLGVFGSVLATIAIVWAINVTNFMDGIDGLAAGETTTVALTAALLIGGAAPDLAAAAALTGGAALGFLPWNWRPARIFMGDTGSGFLGYTLAVLALASERAGAMPVLVWLLLYAMFAADATITIIRRIWRGEQWYTAHRSHAYQRLVQAGWSHASVTGAILLVNVALGVLAWRVMARPGLLGPVLATVAAGCVLGYLLVEHRHPMVAGPRRARVENRAG